MVSDIFRKECFHKVPFMCMWLKGFEEAAAALHHEFC